MRIEIHEIQGFWPAIWGMRNPMQSHDRMDSEPPEEADFAIHEDEDGFVNGEWEPPTSFRFGSDDHSLAMKLANAGTDHGKFLRQIVVWADVTAPEYFFAQLATYRFGVEMNSSSLMHRGLKDAITAGSFEMPDIVREMLTPSKESVGDRSFLYYPEDTEEFRLYELENRSYKVYKNGKIVANPYVVSDSSGRKRHFKERELTPTKRGSGYYMINLGGRTNLEKWAVHRLVAEVWLDRPEGKTQINHIDGNKGNNSVSNLEWVTRSENMQHAWETGLCTKNNRAKYLNYKASAKFTWQDRIRMREMFDSGMTVKEIADKYTEHSYCSIADICHRTDRTGNLENYEFAEFWDWMLELIKKVQEEENIEKLRQIMPMGYMYTKTCMFSYAALRNIYHARRNHKLKEWHTFCAWIERLPYSELITGKEKTND